MCQEFAGFFLQMISGLIIWERKILGNFCFYISSPSNNLLYFDTESKYVSFKVLAHLIIITYSIYIAHTVRRNWP